MTSKEFYQHFTINTKTGEKQWYIPLELTGTTEDLKHYTESLSEYYEVHPSEKLPVGWTRIGYRSFKAVMIPVSYEEYLNYRSAELAKQDAEKLNTRCSVSTKTGKLKVCPLRVKNPEYTGKEGQKKTIAVSCLECPYRNRKNNPKECSYDKPTQEYANGDIIPYEVPSPDGYNQARQYEKLSEQFKKYVLENAPRLFETLELLLDEMCQTEISKITNKSTSTVHSQVQKLKKLLEEFLSITVLF